MTTARPQGETRVVLEVARNHPAYAGHFPGSPVLPGAVLLDEALYEIARSRGIDPTRWQLASAKLLGRVRPGDELILQHCAPAAGLIRFTIRSAGARVAAGTLTRED